MLLGDLFTEILAENAGEDLAPFGNPAAFVVVFVITLFLYSYIGGLIADQITERNVTAVNRSLGFGYGLVRGLLLIGLALMTFNAVRQSDADDPPPEFLAEARSYPMLAWTAELLSGIVGPAVDSLIPPAPEPSGDGETDGLEGQTEGQGIQPTPTLDPNIPLVQPQDGNGGAVTDPHLQQDLDSLVEGVASPTPVPTPAQ